MKVFDIEITGSTPLLMHRMTEDTLFQLLGSKTERRKDKEVLKPREIAEKHAYQNKDGSLYIPSEYISGAFAHVAGDYKQKNSARKSIKSVARGIFRPQQEAIPLLCEKDKPLTTFEVDIRKATNHQKGAVAVCRPRMDRWKAKFQVQIDNSIISEETALQILEDAGRRSGIGSFRVSRGGYFGQFQVTSFQPAVH